MVSPILAQQKFVPNWPCLSFFLIIWRALIIYLGDIGYRLDHDRKEDFERFSRCWFRHCGVTNSWKIKTFWKVKFIKPLLRRRKIFSESSNSFSLWRATWTCESGALAFSVLVVAQTWRKPAKNSSSMLVSHLHLNFFDEKFLRIFFYYFSEKMKLQIVI